MKFWGYEIVIPPLWAAETTVYAHWLVNTTAPQERPSPGLPTGPCSCLRPTLAHPCSHKQLPHLPRCRDYWRQSHRLTAGACSFSVLPLFRISMFHHKTTGQRTSSSQHLPWLPHIIPPPRHHRWLPHLCCHKSSLANQHWSHLDALLWLHTFVYGLLTGWVVALLPLQVTPLLGLVLLRTIPCLKHFN